MTNRQFLNSMTALLLCAGLLVWLQNCTDVDLLLQDWMYDRHQRNFPWKDHWFTAVFMHTRFKHFLIGLSLMCLLGLVIDVTFTGQWLAPETRRKLIGILFASAMIPTIVNFLKSKSIQHCPWDVERYGGSAPYLRLFDHLPAGIQAGHCFPAGHATAALWLPAIALFWLPARPKAAGVAFSLALLPGLAMGWIQQLRGAHFLSHTLWSVWIAAFIIVVIARGIAISEKFVPVRR